LKEEKLFISKKTTMFCRLDCKGKLNQIRETFTEPAIIKDPQTFSHRRDLLCVFSKKQKQKGHKDKQLKTNTKHTDEKTHT
jgi:hypothetical protein